MQDHGFAAGPGVRTAILSSFAGPAAVRARCAMVAETILTSVPLSREILAWFPIVGLCRLGLHIRRKQVVGSLAGMACGVLVRPSHRGCDDRTRVPRVRQGNHPSAICCVFNRKTQQRGNSCWRSSVPSGGSRAAVLWKTESSLTKRFDTFICLHASVKWNVRRKRRAKKRAGERPTGVRLRISIADTPRE
jgi:hypothetical protein